MKFVQLTDTHLVPPGATLHGHDARQLLDAAVRDINAHHGDAELFVLTGDLTHWGEPEAFQSLAEGLAPLTMPVHLLIGNHDDRGVFATHFPDQALDSSGFVQSITDTSTGRFIFLDTVLAGTHAGHYCAARCAWLTTALAGAEADGKDIFLFMHHPPFDTGIPPIDRIGLQQKEAFREVVAPYKHRIRHLFFGHAHRPIAGSWLGIPVSTLRSLAHQVGFDLKSEKLQGNFEPPAYCVVLVDAETIVVHFHDFMDGSQKFLVHDSPWNDWNKGPGGGAN